MCYSFKLLLFFHLYVQFQITDIKISANSMVLTKFLDFKPPDF